jgi:hypothetical protein
VLLSNFKARREKGQVHDDKQNVMAAILLVHGLTQGQLNTIAS